MPKKNELDQQQKYSPAQTAQIKESQIRDIVRSYNVLPSKRIDIKDVNLVKACAYNYIEKCADSGIIPSFEGLCYVMGCSRKWAYEFCRLHPEHETSKYLDEYRTQLGAIRVAAAERGAIDPTFTIFILKNSGLDYSDKHEITFEQSNILESMNEDSEKAKQRILESLPEIEGE